MNVNPITIAPVFPLWLIILLFCLALAQAAAQCVKSWTKLGPRRALVISLLRFAAIVVVVIFALNPSVVTRKEHRIAPLPSLWTRLKAWGNPSPVGKHPVWVKPRLC